MEKIINYSPKITIINEKKIFKRKNDDDSKFNLEYLEDRLSENKISKVQSLSDLTKIKIIIHSITEEIGTMPLGIGNNSYLFQENGEIKIKTFYNLIDVNKFETKYGLMITEDRGEWGGSLYNVTENGAEKVAYGNFKYVFEYNNKVYATSSISHLGGHRCSLHEIKKFDDKFVDIAISRTEGMTISGAFCENNYLYFYSNSFDCNGLYRFNLDNNELKLIHEDLCWMISVNSLLKKDNYIYIHGNYNLIKYDLNSKEMEIFTNLEDNQLNTLYIGRFKLIEFWDELFLDK